MNEPKEVKPIDDIRSYIAALEANGVLNRVKAEVDWKYELCHVSKVNEEQKGPALLYENVKGYDIPVFTSAFTTPQRIAICLEQDPSLSMCQLSRKWMELTTKQMVKPKYVDKPPVMENVIEDDAVDIDMFPSPWFYPDDGGRFFGTSAFMVSRDPDTGWTNLGTYRAQVLGKNILGSQIIKGKHGDMHMKKYQERGELMPAAYVVGCDPVLFLASSTLVSAQTDEYDVAGSLRGRPVDVFKSDLTGLTYPANAEIIAEGFIDPNELMEEGPFGEYTGYYSGNKGKDYPKAGSACEAHPPSQQADLLGDHGRQADQRYPHDPVAQPHGDTVARPGNHEGSRHTERLLTGRGNRPVLGHCIGSPDVSGTLESRRRRSAWKHDRALWRQRGHRGRP